MVCWWVLPEIRRGAGLREAEEKEVGRGLEVGRHDGEPGRLVGRKMIPWCEGQLGPGHRQAQIALVLVVETGAWLLDVVVAVVSGEVAMVTQDIGTGHTRSPDHERDRQGEAPESDGWSNGHDSVSRCVCLVTT